MGNPGPDYTDTFHNLGADVVHLLAERHGGQLKGGKHNALIDDVRIAGRHVVLAFPLTYMNESGRAVGPIMKWYGLEHADQLIVVHDELDLEPGRMKVKAGGGLAGHNGLRSITQHLGTQDFLRVRIGVGKPPSKERGAGHVLAKIPKAMRAEMAVVVAEAADAVEMILADGVEAAMTRCNG